MGWTSASSSPDPKGGHGARLNRREARVDPLLYTSRAGRWLRVCASSCRLEKSVSEFPTHVTRRCPPRQYSYVRSTNRPSRPSLSSSVAAVEMGVSKQGGFLLLVATKQPIGCGQSDTDARKSGGTAGSGGIMGFGGSTVRSGGSGGTGATPGTGGSAVGGAGGSTQPSGGSSGDGGTPPTGGAPSGGSRANPTGGLPGSGGDTAGAGAGGAVVSGSAANMAAATGAVEVAGLAAGTGIGGTRPARTRRSRRGRSMSTGQASLHAPHRLEARAVSPKLATPNSPGETTAPMGPE